MDIYIQCKNCGKKHKFTKLYSMSLILNDFNGAEIKCTECGKEYSVRVTLYENKNNKEKE